MLEPYSLSFKPVRVVHCPKAFGFVFNHKSGWKIVYSGDTRPCDALISEGFYFLHLSF